MLSLHCTSRTVVLTPDQSEAKWMEKFSKNQVEWGLEYLFFLFIILILLACL